MLAAEKVAGTRHHVALSVVGTERMLDSGYFRAKMAQEKLIKASGVPYTILRATQFFEFIGAIAYSGREDGNTIHLTAAALQPVASVDVAAALTAIAQKAPNNQTAEVAGPDRRFQARRDGAAHRCQEHTESLSLGTGQRGDRSQAPANFQENSRLAGLG